MVSVQKVGRRLRRAIVLFHPLQRTAFHARSDRRPPDQRHRLRCRAAISYTNGIQGDGSYKLNSDTHAARRLLRQRRAGICQQYVAGRALHALRRRRQRRAVSASPTMSPRLGWLAGVYVQDEWKLTNQLTMNYGLRFDQMDQFVSANQFSPRLSFTYKPFENTTFHAGYARYFTPPVLVEAAPVNLALFNNTTGAPSGQNRSGPAGALALFRCRRRPEIQFGCGSDRKSCSDSRAWRRCLLQDRDRPDRQRPVWPSLVLSAFNYARGIQ